ncbi:MAG: SoxR reducing system RseC family protein [Syntrophobacterales bacterium]|nr:MAG: SoxR reducing system RseC family protein [Syntrophobacterales bacterium]
MVPILALIIGAVIESSLDTPYKEIRTVSMGVGFLVGSYFVIKALNKHFENKAEYLPVIIEILPDQISGNHKMY